MNLEMFTGDDVTTFVSFMKNCQLIVEERCETTFEKYYYLKRYTRGLPHELVNSCDCLDADTAYRNAMKTLQEEYGNEYKAAMAYIKKLENVAPIKSEDGEALRDLSITLMTCANNMNHVTSLNQLNSPNEIMKIVPKLPYELRKR